MILLDLIIFWFSVTTDDILMLRDPAMIKFQFSVTELNIQRVKSKLNGHLKFNLYLQVYSSSNFELTFSEFSTWVSYHRLVDSFFPCPKKSSELGLLEVQALLSFNLSFLGKLVQKPAHNTSAQKIKNSISIFLSILLQL